MRLRLLFSPQSDRGSVLSRLQLCARNGLRVHAQEPGQQEIYLLLERSRYRQVCLWLELLAGMFKDRGTSFIIFFKVILFSLFHFRNIDVKKKKDSTAAMIICNLLTERQLNEN